MKSGAPLRFLTLVLLGWIGLRVMVLMPDWWREANGDVHARSSPRLGPGTPVPAPAVPATGAAEVEDRAAPPWRVSRTPGRVSWLASQSDHVMSRQRVAGAAIPLERSPAATPVPAQIARPPGLATPLPLRAASRWSGSAWMLLRREADGPALAPGGTLGGSQAGARILYRLNGDAARPLALGVRIYAPLRRAAAAEVAAGLDWQPVADIPLHMLAERRQALAENGRSTFALAVYGGHSARIGILRVDSYAQAGVVGARSRDLFIDGSARISAPIGPVEAGGAVWGAAQPDARRLDAGPQLSLPLAVRGANLRLSAEWRFRLAGDAAPDSGPAVTLGADF